MGAQKNSLNETFEYPRHKFLLRNMKNNFILLVHTLIWRPGPEVIKLELILKLKIKRYDWLLADRKQPIIALYFEIETVLSLLTSGLDDHDRCLLFFVDCR